MIARTLAALTFLIVAWLCVMSFAYLLINSVGS